MTTPLPLSFSPPFKSTPEATIEKRYHTNAWQVTHVGREGDEQGWLYGIKVYPLLNEKKLDAYYQ